MVTYTTAVSKSDLEGILKLQKANLPRNLNVAEIESQGFVTVDHSYKLLKKMNDTEPHVIAKDGDKVAGYVLAMTKELRNEIPILFPMFSVFDNIAYNGKKISDFNYMLVGQVCVDKAYRGQGVFDNCYEYYRKCYGNRYDFAITEIAVTNTRSLKAHRRVGFEEIYFYTGPDKTEWIVVIWDWKK
ncbi:MAG: GNAT family N-acetyltransferase [Chitinophagaceae bacterium]|nr:GNAT family N-acetyltransferase [Chitinophagaceae bacterium]